MPENTENPNIERKHDSVPEREKPLDRTQDLNLKTHSGEKRQSSSNLFKRLRRPRDIAVSYPKRSYQRETEEGFVEKLSGDVITPKIRVFARADSASGDSSALNLSLKTERGPKLARTSSRRDLPQSGERRRQVDSATSEKPKARPLASPKEEAPSGGFFKKLMRLFRYNSNKATPTAMSPTRKAPRMPSKHRTLSKPSFRGERRYEGDGRYRPKRFRKDQRYQHCSHSR